MHHQLTAGFQFGLAGAFLICAGLNFGFAYHYAHDKTKKNIWGAVGFLFLLFTLVYLFTATFDPALAPVIPESVVKLSTAILNHIWGPIIYFVGSSVAFVTVLYWRKWITNPTVAIALMNVLLLMFCFAMTNEDFQSIITKEDNVPIVMLIFNVAFFTWFALRRAVINDDLIAANKPVLEKDDEK